MDNVTLTRSNFVYRPIVSVYLIVILKRMSVSSKSCSSSSVQYSVVHIDYSCASESAMSATHHSATVP